nr:hypothetical protein [Acidithiobacillus ferriphilus]
MIILVIDQFDIGPDKPEGDAPVAVHPDGPVPSEVALQWMEPVAGMVQLDWRRGGERRLNAAWRTSAVEGFVPYAGS